MTFTKQDKKDYASWLMDQLKTEEKKVESLFTNYNIFNLSKDLINIQKQLTNK